MLEQEQGHGSQCEVMEALAPKSACTAETLHEWAALAEWDSGLRTGLASSQRVRVKAHERENCELQRSNEIQRTCVEPAVQAVLDRRGK